MTYKVKILVRLGREIAAKHPLLAKQIVEGFLPPTNEDLTKLDIYFERFCKKEKIDPEKIKGRVFKSPASESKKVFLSAMLSVYKNQPLFNKKISETLGQKSSRTSQMLSEVRFRYRKDPTFIEKVDSTIKKLIKKRKP